VYVPGTLADLYSYEHCRMTLTKCCFLAAAGLFVLDAITVLWCASSFCCSYVEYNDKG